VAIYMYACSGDVVSLGDGIRILRHGEVMNADPRLVSQRLQSLGLRYRGFA